MNGNADEFKELLDQARAGCRDSASLLLNHYESYLTLISDSQLDRRLRAKVGVSDVVQQTYRKAVENLDAFNGDTSAQLGVWLKTIAVNEVNLFRRHYKTGKRNLSDEQRIVNGSRSGQQPTNLYDDSDTPGTSVVKDEQAKKVRAALKQLSAEHQRVIRLRNWEGKSFSDIAGELGKSEAATRKIWQRALIKLDLAFRDES